MQRAQLVPTSGRLAFIVAVGFAAVALSLTPRPSIPSFTLPLHHVAPQVAPSVMPAQPVESVAPARPASAATTAPAQSEQTAPASAATPKPAAPAAAPAQSAPQRVGPSPALSGGDVMSVAPEDGAPVLPNPRIR